MHLLNGVESQRRITPYQFLIRRSLTDEQTKHQGWTQGGSNGHEGCVLPSVTDYLVAA